MRIGDRPACASATGRHAQRRCLARPSARGRRCAHAVLPLGRLGPAQAAHAAPAAERTGVSTRSWWEPRASPPIPRCSTTAACPRRSSTRSPGRCAIAPPPRTTRCGRATSAPRSSSRRRSGARPTSSPAAEPLLLGNADVRVSYVVAAASSPLYRNACSDECVFVEAGDPRRVRDQLRRARGPRRRLRRAAARNSAPLGAARGGTAARARDRVRGPRGAAAPLPLRERPAARDRTLLRARSARPVGAVARGGEGRAGLREAPRGERRLVGLDPRDRRARPRRGRLGRLPLSPRLQRARFRAPHGPRAPAPAGAPGLRGTRLRDLQLRRARWTTTPRRSPRRTTTRTWTATRCSSTWPATYGARRGSGVAAGSITLARSGRAQPHPGAYEASIGRERMDELAVMLDTFRPLELGEGARACEDASYAGSWSTARSGRPAR